MAKEDWLDGYDGDEWLETVDDDGELVGYIKRREAYIMDLPIRLVETPKRYLDDPWVRYHARLAHRRGLFTRAQDLNQVQLTLLASEMVKEQELTERLRVRTFEERLMSGNPELYRAYLEQKEKEEEQEDDMVGVEERIPRSVEEFLAALGAFSGDDDSEDTKEREHAGWLSSYLSEEDLDQMSD